MLLDNYFALDLSIFFFFAPSILIFSYTLNECVHNQLITLFHGKCHIGCHVDYDSCGENISTESIFFFFLAIQNHVI